MTATALPQTYSGRSNENPTPLVKGEAGWWELPEEETTPSVNETQALTYPWRDLTQATQLTLEGIQQAVAGTWYGINEAIQETTTIFGSLLRSWGSPLNAWNLELELGEPKVFVRTASPRGSRAVLAAIDLQKWLNLTAEEVAEIGGFSRRSFFHWQSGMDPRPSSIRHLFQVHGVIASLVRSIGISETRAWLAQKAYGESRLSSLRRSDGAIAVLREANELLFEVPSSAKGALIPEFLQEDLTTVSEPGRFTSTGRGFLRSEP